jgi:signal transduction histidine kinase
VRDVAGNRGPIVSERIFDLRVDRVIALARAALACFAIFAVWLDPTQPVQYAEATYIALGVYSACAVALALSLWLGNATALRFATPMQLLDPVVFAALVYLSDGTNSPFFLFFVFAVFSAMLKWHWRGALIMSVVVVILHLASGAVLGLGFLQGQVDMQRFVLRSGYLIVGGVMMAFFGLHQRRITRDMMRLAAWPPPGLEEKPESAIRQVLSFAASVFRARSVFFASNEAKSRQLTVAEWKDGRFEGTVSLGAHGPAVFEPVTGRAFLFDAGTQMVTYWADRNELLSVHASPIDAALLEGRVHGKTLCIPISADAIDGWIFVVDAPHFAPEDLVIATAASARISAHLERSVAIGARRTAALAEERLNLALDLHDTVLQSLAGIALQAEGLLKEIPEESTNLRDRVRGFEDKLTADQRELRKLIARLRGRPEPAEPAELDLQMWLGALAEQLRSQWEVGFDVVVGPPDIRVSTEIARGIHRIVLEGVSNAVRHGGAKQIEVVASQNKSVLSLQLIDDGSGIPNGGLHDETDPLNVQPKSIRDRARQLGGSLSVQSGVQGTRLTVTIPVHA